MASDNFSTLFDLLPIGAYRSTPEGRLLRVNVALAKLNGYATEAEMLASVNNAASERYVDAARLDDFKTRMRSEGRVLDFVAEIYRLKTRARIWVRENAQLVRDEQGIPKYYEGTVQDITLEHESQARVKGNADLFESLIHTIPDLIWLKDTQGAYQACNPAFERHFGASAAMIIGKTDDFFIGNETAMRLARTDQTPLTSGQCVTFEEELATPDGERLGVFEVIKAPVRNAAGEITGVLGMARDISRRKLAENLLRDASEQFELALVSADLGMWAQTIDYPSKFEMDLRGITMLGLTPQNFDHCDSWTEFVHPDDLPGAVAEMKLHLSDQTPFFKAEYRARHALGHWVWLSSRGKVVRSDIDGRALRVVGTQMDITERKEGEEMIRQMAFQDPLTGLPNRRLLMDRLVQALTASVRHKRCGALLFLDLDRFKHLNDTLGHDMGDLLLQQVAKRILASVRAVDTVARIGGDEFVVLIADLSESAEYAQTHAERVGQKILAALNEPYQLGEHSHVCTPSIGAAMFTDFHLTPSDVLKQADRAMYEAKANGRNMLRFYEESAMATPG